MGNLTAQAAKKLLADNPDAYATKKALLDLANQLDTASDGSA